MTAETKTCAECKHFVMVPNTAHQTQCKRYAPVGQTSIPCALARPAEEFCNGGAGWEAHG